MYNITLTQEDVETISFVGHRYAWAEALSGLTEGENIIPEHEAWEIMFAFESDTEGGHQFFPMLNLQSELAGKLFAFLDSIV